MAAEVTEEPKTKQPSKKRNLEFISEAGAVDVQKAMKTAKSGLSKVHIVQYIKRSVPEALREKLEEKSWVFNQQTDIKLALRSRTVGTIKGEQQEIHEVVIEMFGWNQSTSISREVFDECGESLFKLLIATVENFVFLMGFWSTRYVSVDYTATVAIHWDQPLFVL